MSKINDHPIKDPEPGGSILKMEEWKAYAPSPNEECMNLLAGKLEPITCVRPPYLTIFDNLAEIPANHTKLMKGFGLATSFFINAHLILPCIYHIIFGALKGVEAKYLNDNNDHTTPTIHLLKYGFQAYLLNLEIHNDRNM